MNLNEAINLIAAQLHCDADELQSYADEDTRLGGYHWNGALATFPAGSVWGVEGQVLYALTRYLKPAKVVEVGSWGGCSAAHLALAVKANGSGHVYSVDNASETSFEPGYLLPSELKPYVTLIRANGQDYLAEQDDGSIGLLFEDANHSTALVRQLVELGLKKCEAGGVIVNHDAARQFAYDGTGQIASSSDLGRQIRDGIAQANAYFRPYLVEPSDCGFSVIVVPGTKKNKPVDLSKYTSEQMWEAAERSGKVYDDYQGDDKFILTQSDMEKVSTSPIASDHLAAMSQMGNANIESVSEPPPVKKTRTRKPKAK